MSLENSAQYAYRTADSTHTAVDANVVTPSDSVELLHTRALYIGGSGGNIKVTMIGGTTVTFTGLSPGTILPIQVKQVWSTDTTVSASNILALY